MKLGNIYGFDGGSFAGNVWGTDDVSPTISTAQGGGRQPMIVDICAMRGNGCTNTLTTVAKDNLVLERVPIKLGNAANSNQRCAVYDENGLCPTIQAAAGAGGNQQPMWVEVKQATKEGYTPCKIGGVANLAYPDSKTRRGRVIDNGMTSPTITTENVPNVLEPWTWKVDGITYLIRIRKLTPKECWRLMGFTDEDFEKAEKVNSNTQLYKQAGNSIVKHVLMAAIGQLL